MWEGGFVSKEEMKDFILYLYSAAVDGELQYGGDADKWDYENKPNLEEVLRIIDKAYTEKDD